jgi:hypothetical protein
MRTEEGQTLPDEILLHLLCFLDNECDIGRSAQVNKQWNRVATDLWKRWCEIHYGCNAKEPISYSWSTHVCHISHLNHTYSGLSTIDARGNTILHQELLLHQQEAGNLPNSLPTPKYNPDRIISLIEHGYQLGENNKRRSVLDLAARVGDVNIVKMLLKHNGVDMLKVHLNKYNLAFCLKRYSIGRFFNYFFRFDVHEVELRYHQQLVTAILK